MSSLTLSNIDFFIYLFIYFSAHINPPNSLLYSVGAVPFFTFQSKILIDCFENC